jgi:radical SAM superfamily enzyme YgiQ (UPF0313 family)
MNVLLVMPRTGYLWDEWATPPVGIAYVSAYLKANGVNVYPVNMNLEDSDIESVLTRYMKQYHIDIVGTGELVVNWEKLQEICHILRKIDASVKIWIGGGLVTNSPYEAMKLIPDADYGMIGEGEITSLELVQMLERTGGVYSEEDISTVDGLIVRRPNGELFYTKPRANIENLDTIPFPDWEGFRLVETCKKYAKNDNGVVASVVSSRSCPNSCTFCSKSGGKKYKKRSLDNVFAEIEELVNKYHVTRLNFNDELFADSSNRLYEFCDRIEKYHIKYRVSMHIGKNLTLPLLKRMRESGCSVIYYGLESADDNVLKSMRKHTTIAGIESCLQLTKQAGIAVEGCFIFGDPVETPESVQKTMNWIEKHFNMGFFEVSAIKLYPGSQLYEDALINGTITDTVKFIEEGCPLRNVSSLTDEQYWHMVNYDLTMVQHMRAKRQKDVKVEKHGKIIMGETICSFCGEKISFEVEDPFDLLRMYTKHCTKCGAIEYINLFPTYYDLIRKKIEMLISEHNMAIFGCGNIWKMFYAVGEEFHNSNYDIVDETPFLQLDGWNGHKVYSPAILKEHKNDVLLVMARVSRKEILEKMKQYGIDNIEIYMCYDLLE